VDKLSITLCQMIYTQLLTPDMFGVTSVHWMLVHQGVTVWSGCV